MSTRKTWLDTYNTDYVESIVSRATRYASIQEHAQLWFDGIISVEDLIEALEMFCFTEDEFTKILANLKINAEG